MIPFLHFPGKSFNNISCFIDLILHIVVAFQCLLRVNMDLHHSCQTCLVHWNGKDAGKCIMQTFCVFCFCLHPCFPIGCCCCQCQISFATFCSTISSSFFYLFYLLLSQQNGSPMNQHLPYTSCWSCDLKKGPWRSSHLGQTRIGTWVNFWANLLVAINGRT